MKDNIVTDEMLVDRAYAGYKKVGETKEPSNDSHTQWYKGHLYVVLSNMAGILAVYRVLTLGDESKKLKRLKVWPRQLGAIK